MSNKNILNETIERPNLDVKPSKVFVSVFTTLLISGLFFVGWSLINQLEASGAPVSANYTSLMTYGLLAVILLIALGFEFVNGFHDTANAVATVIYTHSLPPHFAVIWSGIFNLLGVLLSSGIVAFAIVSLLPVDLVMEINSNLGIAMIFALLTSAIIWNLGTWLLGIPNSSSHTLIGSIIGVGLADAFIRGRDGLSGIDLSRVYDVIQALIFSTIIGFVISALVLLALKAIVKNKALFESPKGKSPPPFWIRSLLILTCTGVSFAHGSNDGQKGMGLIMLILIGTVPIAYALNHPITSEQKINYVAISKEAQQTLHQVSSQNITELKNPRETLINYVRTKKESPDLLIALSKLSEDIALDIENNGNLSKIPANTASNLRNDMYLASETISFIQKDNAIYSRFDSRGKETLTAFKKINNEATQFIPIWVKIAVAIALGLGTMVGWKKIVITVGEKIGKTHLTYGQGASAEFVAMLTIGAADLYGLPVSTTHVLTSGVAGTMAANKSGVDWKTLKNLMAAWILTLPGATLLSGSLFYLFATAMH